jgi:hypothetical protein
MKCHKRHIISNRLLKLVSGKNDLADGNKKMKKKLSRVEDELKKG